MISDLPKELAEEVFSRISLTSLRNFRLTCKDWNNLSKDESVNKKRIDEAKAASEFIIKVIVIDHRVYLMSLNLANSSINLQGKLVSLVDSDPAVFVSQVYRCDGLLLCITKDFAKRFLVWNPYTCQTRWFEPRTCQICMDFYTYAIGYDENKSFKVMRFVPRMRLCEIYELSSNSCKLFKASSDYKNINLARGVSLKGNTYWFARELYPERGNCLICFDFTREKFGPRLGLPYRSGAEDRTTTLSSIREEQLALLYKPFENSHMMEIWVTTRIEPQVVAWSKFLAVDMRPLVNLPLPTTQPSFFIDQEKKIAVVFDKDGKSDASKAAYIIGEDGYFREIDLEEYKNLSLVVCSYVPSFVQIKQRRKRKRKNMVTN